SKAEPIAIDEEEEIEEEEDLKF
ncbi:MAG: hypothetical protein QG594_2192, partial [Bacteroidota bacterium]|nr:hypothetical protein [Bacteroidota bacterium]